MPHGRAWMCMGTVETGLLKPDTQPLALSARPPAEGPATLKRMNGLTLDLNYPNDTGIHVCVSNIINGILKKWATTLKL